LLNFKANGQLMELKAGNDLKMLDVSGIINGSYHIRLFSNENVIITSKEIKVRIKVNRLNLHKEVQPVCC